MSASKVESDSILSVIQVYEEALSVATDPVCVKFGFITVSFWHVLQSI
jgi:hypothetical protein